MIWIKIWRLRSVWCCVGSGHRKCNRNARRKVRFHLRCPRLYFFNNRCNQFGLTRDPAWSHPEQKHSHFFPLAFSFGGYEFVKNGRMTSRFARFALATTSNWIRTLVFLFHSVGRSGLTFASFIYAKELSVGSIVMLFLWSADFSWNNVSRTWWFMDLQMMARLFLFYVVNLK